MIHAVRVVPMLAPMMTEMACTSVSSPAFTNETVIRVVAVELCTAAVTNIPVKAPVKRFVVIAPSTWRNCGPAIFWSASLIDFMPNISNANEPKSLKTIIKDMGGVCLVYWLFCSFNFFSRSFCLSILCSSSR